MVLRSAQAWGLPVLNEMSTYLKTKGQLLPISSSFYVIKNEFWKLADRYKMCSTNKRDLPTPPLSILLFGWIADYGIDYE